MTAALDPVSSFIRRLALAIAAVCVFSTAAMAQTYPLTFEHKFGTTTLEQAPERVASVDYVGADDLLALGVQPVTIRYWYGDYPHAVWPWADPLLEGEPEILQGDLNFEQIAATEPDVIIAIASGITQQDYDQLSTIAPVVAVPDGIGDFALPWDERALLTGRIVGKEDAAQTQVDAIRDQLASVSEAHPDWSGKSAVIGYAWGDGSQPGVYTSYDVRAQLVEQMGFETPEAIDALTAEGEFYAYISPEDLSPFDADLLIWVTSDTWDGVTNLVARPYLDVVREGRDVYVGPELTGAFSFSSLLSLPYAIDALVPMIEAALDGDPETHADQRPE